MTGHLNNLSVFAYVCIQSYYPVIEITAEGIKTMREVMGVKSEIDLREVDNGEIGGISSSPLGDDVQYVNLPMKWDGGCLSLRSYVWRRLYCRGWRRDSLLSNRSLLRREAAYQLDAIVNLLTTHI